MSPRRIKLNISGDIFETFEKTLKRYPETLLGNADKLRIFYCRKYNEYFFNRSRKCFDAILYFYQSDGILSCPSGITINHFEGECQFFELPMDLINKMKEKHCLLLDDAENENREQATSIQMKVWYLLEKPRSSMLAGYFAIFSLFMIGLSVLVSCLETVPALNNKHLDFERNPWLIIECILNSWFLMELVVRLVSCPNKKRFLKGTMNWVDAVSIVPYFIILIHDRSKLKSVGFLRILRLLRVFRLFRLSKHSKRIKVVGDIIKSSLEDLQILMICLLMVMVIGASIMFYLEDNHVFNSIPEGIWWAVQTVTTLGYGDVIPRTIAGKIFSACFMAGGAITISLPVLSIVTKFSLYYVNNI